MRQQKEEGIIIISSVNKYVLQRSKMFEKGKLLYKSYSIPTCLPLDPKFAGSNLAKDDGF
jgi:hypothetical protein